MGNDREGYEPLWATGLARPPRPPEDDELFRPSSPREPAPPAAPPFPARLATVLAALVAVAVVVAAVLSTRPGGITIADVPSGWSGTSMTCATTRIEGRSATVELFRCRATGGGGLPPGIYTAPETTWNSDIDRRAAVSHYIRISPAGRLTGRALYVP